LLHDESPSVEFGFASEAPQSGAQETKLLHGGGEVPVRPRRQGRRGMAFIGAERKPLTEGADGSGAGFG